MENERADLVGLSWPGNASAFICITTRERESQYHLTDSDNPPRSLSSISGASVYVINEKKKPQLCLIQSKGAYHCNINEYTKAGMSTLKKIIRAFSPLRPVHDNQMVALLIAGAQTAAGTLAVGDTAILKGHVSVRQRPNSSAQSTNSHDVSWHSLGRASSSGSQQRMHVALAKEAATPVSPSALVECI